MVWYSHLFKSFVQFVMIHTVKSFSVVTETEIDVFLEFSRFLYDPANVGNLISGSSAFSKPSLCIWKFSIHEMLKPSLKDFEDNLIRMWNEYGIWTFFSTAPSLKKKKKFQKVAIHPQKRAALHHLITCKNEAKPHISAPAPSGSLKLLILIILLIIFTFGIQIIPSLLPSQGHIFYFY